MNLSLKKPKQGATGAQKVATRVAGGSVIPTIARVNLLPKEITERRGLKSLQRILAVAVLAVVVLGAVLAFLSSMSLSNAQDSLTAEQQRTTTLLAEQRRYAAVTVVTDRLRLTNDALEYVSRSDVDWSLVLGMIASVTPEDVLIAEMKADTATPLVGSGDGNAALMPATIGAFELKGTAIDRPNVSMWASGLEALPGVSEARISVVEQSDADDKEFYAVTVTMQLDPSLQRADGRIANLPPQEGKN